MGVLKVAFTYDDPSATFSKGEAIRGKIHLQAETSIHIKKIKVKLLGDGFVQLQTTTSNYNRNMHNHTTSTPTFREDYLKEKKVIYENIVVPKGDSTFPFEVQLPDDLPDTFKCFKGAIAYKCAVLLQCDEKVSLMSNQISASLPFTIRSLVDVSQQRDANMMATLEENHKIKIPCLCCLCFSFGNVRVSITTDKTAYVRGEDILINVTVTNRSLSKLTYIKASLVQVITCVYSNRPGPITYNEIAKLHRADDFNGTSDLVWSNAVLKIPDDAPNSRLGGGCNIIRMDYKVMITVGQGGCCCSPKAFFHLPIFIGGIRSITTISLNDERFSNHHPAGS